MIINALNADVDVFTWRIRRRPVTDYVDGLMQGQINLRDANVGHH